MGILGTILSPITSLIGSIADNRAQKNQNQANLKLAQFQFDKNLEMWNLQNEYNKPLNQMTRLEEAGLNPNLVYGTGTVTGNTVGSAPQYEAPHITKYQKYQQAASAAVQMATAVQSIKNAKAQENKTNMDSIVAKNQAEYFASQKEYVDQKIKAQKNSNLLFDMFGITNASHEAETIRYNAGLTLGRANAQEQENNLREPRFLQWQKESNARIKRMSVQNRESFANIMLSAVRARLMESQIGLTNAQIEAVLQTTKNQITKGKLDALDLYNRLNGVDGRSPTYLMAGLASGITRVIMEAIGETDNGMDIESMLP